MNKGKTNLLNYGSILKTKNVFKYILMLCKLINKKDLLFKTILKGKIFNYLEYLD